MLLLGLLKLSQRHKLAENQRLDAGCNLKLSSESFYEVVRLDVDGFPKVLDLESLDLALDHSLQSVEGLS